MRRTQSNYLSMAKGTLAVFDNHQDVWKDEPLIVEGVRSIRTTCGKIDVEAVSQVKNSTPGRTAMKDRYRETLEKRLFRIGGRVKVYAQKTGDRVTASQVAFSRSSLTDMSLNTLLITARKVVELAEELGEVLAPYKVTEEGLNELREAIETTADMNAQRDAAQGERSENTMRLAELFVELRKEFKLMDTQVDAYIDQKEFLGTYSFARKVDDVHGKSKSKKEAEDRE